MVDHNSPYEGKLAGEATEFNHHPHIWSRARLPYFVSETVFFALLMRAGKSAPIASAMRSTSSKVGLRSPLFNPAEHRLRNARALRHHVLGELAAFSLLLQQTDNLSPERLIVTKTDHRRIMAENQIDNYLPIGKYLLHYAAREACPSPTTDTERMRCNMMFLCVLFVPPVYFITHGKWGGFFLDRVRF